MSKMLAVFAVVGLLLSAALLGGAWLLGGDNIFHDPRTMEGLKPLIDLATRKEWRWAGGDTLALDAPMTVRYEPHNETGKAKPSVTITGPAEAMDHVRFHAGRITSDAVPPAKAKDKNKDRDTDKDTLQAVVSGIPIHRFIVNGGESLQLGHVVQDDLTIYINGNGAVSGDGKVGHLTLVLNGPGAAALGALEVGDANVSILGPGRVTLSPHGALNLFAVGGSRISLLTRPASINRRIFGGVIIEMPVGVEGSPPPVSPMPATPERPSVPPVPPVEPTAATAPGAAPEQVVVRGDKKINFGHIDQQRFSVTITGTGSATAEGRVDTLEVNAKGSGNADLGALTARHVIVNLKGASNVTIAPTEDVKINISGSGDVHLTTRPPQIERNITGSGRVIER